MSELNKLTATEASAKIASGEITSVELVKSCLDRIHQRENDVGAWAHLNEELTLAAAAVADATERKSPLHGIPFGVKDVIDTADLPTELGTPIHAGRQPEKDAACVAKMKAAGAVLMGKCVSTEYALYKPNQTRNPLNLAHTPGGSSSGSGAAVGDYMVPIAFGNQTAGSLIRPASFCGICAFKPTHGITDLTGILPLEPTFDTLGYMGRSFDDLASFFAIVHDKQPEPLSDGLDRPPRIGLCRTPQWSHAEQASIDAVEGAADRLAGLGAEVDEVALPADFGDLVETHTRALNVGLSRSLIEDYRNHKDMMGDIVCGLIEDGLACSPENAAALFEHAADCRGKINDAFGNWDVFLCPSVVGEAPAGIAATGSPIFQVIWTLLNVPIATIPGAAGPNGLPVGVQFVGRRGDDATVLRLAKWFHSRRN